MTSADRSEPEAPVSASEALLVEAAVRGDRRAAEQILRQLLPRVRNLVRYLVRGDTDTDDIAQESLVAILRGLPTYRADAPLQAWADRVVANATFAQLKKRRRDPARPQRQDPDLTLVRQTSREASQPGNAYLQRRRVAELLDQLPEAQRQVVVLHHGLGMTVPEIAKELRTAAETVRSRLRLARSRLRTEAERDPTEPRLEAERVS